MLHKYLRLPLLVTALAVMQGVDHKGIMAQEATPTVAEPDTISRQETLQEFTITRTQILGSKFKARNRTGSAYYLSPEELKKSGAVDINRLLGSVPGVHIYEEDGYGLRPNISLRGTKAERSERVSIMEDGVLAAPAPYSAPAAYYFPNVGRMYAVEVLKGSSQIQYGPFTTGGAINLVSTPIPKKWGGEVRASYGMNNTLKGYGKVGDRKRQWGYLVEYLRNQSHGFKHYTNDTPVKGFWRNDVIAKVMWQNDPDADLLHSLELKVGYADEHSDETYLGLTESDFATTPYSRYLGSQMDNMKTQHQQYVLTYQLEPFRQASVTLHLYHNHFKRNWYKLNDVRVGVMKEEKESIANVLLFPETLSKYYDIVTGRADYVGEALMVRANKRAYNSSGIQGRMDYRYRLGDEVYMTSELGLRYHVDSEDRYQHDDGYSMIGGKMELFRAGEPGSQSNRITSAKALAGYFQTKMQWRGWTVNAGVRYEDVQLLKRDFGKHDPYRTGGHRTEVRNSARAIIPSVGASYQPWRFATIFAGVHRGFAPPSAELFQEAENSTNMELGVRVSHGTLHTEVIGFFNAFTNMLGSDLTAAGGQGTLEQFNVGAANVYGVEFLVQYQPLPSSWKVKLPLQFQYTFTNTEMKNSFQSPAWGVVHPGDEIPYIYKHSMSGSVGVEYGPFVLTLSGRYKGDTRSEPGQGEIALTQLIPGHFVVDANAKYQVTRHIAVTLNAVNITNARYLASRHPAGLRPGHPFGIYGGCSVNF